MKKSNVLVVGSGGREHAIAWKVSQSPLARKVFVAPGNGGTSPSFINLPIDSTDIESLYKFAKKNECFTIVGPELPLERGIVDLFRANNLPIFGPTMDEARLETSKIFSKNFMKKNNIPTADFKSFSNYEEAISYLASVKDDRSVVVKADGLASGKGVVVCSSFVEAKAAVGSMMRDRVFGKAGERIVIEEMLKGRELSVFALCDGKCAIPFGTAVDHKRLLDGGRGPNTGGMGAYSPAEGAGTELEKRIFQMVMAPAVKASGFHGFLYAGLMLCKEEGIKVLEFNTRLGDPETQVILPLLKSDLLELLMNSEKGESKIEPTVEFSEHYSCGVVMCSKGYPQNTVVGAPIKILQKHRSSGKNPVYVFHSGTRLEKGNLVTSGGRVLCVTAVGRTHNEAVEAAYSEAQEISWEGEFHRSDIGKKQHENGEVVVPL